MFKLIFFMVIANAATDEAVVLRTEPALFTTATACQGQGASLQPIEQARPEVQGRRVRYLCVPTK